MVHIALVLESGCEHAFKIVIQELLTTIWLLTLLTLLTLALAYKIITVNALSLIHHINIHGSSLWVLSILQLHLLLLHHLLIIILILLLRLLHHHMLVLLLRLLVQLLLLSEGSNIALLGLWATVAELRGGLDLILLVFNLINDREETLVEVLDVVR